MNKKGQVISIIVFVAIIMGILILAPFIMKTINTIVTPFGNALNSTSTEATATVFHVRDKAIGLMDYVILSMFLLNVVILFISAFMVDVHPAFVVLYIIGIFFLVILAFPMLDIVKSIWGDNNFTLEASQLPVTQFIVNNFAIVMLAIVVLSGVVMYAKFKLTGSSMGGSGY